MGNVIKQTAGNVSSNGNGLVVYVDTITNEVMLKDVVGNTQSLKDYFKFNDILFSKLENNSFAFASETNKVESDNSVVLVGTYNVVRGNNSSVLSGEANTVSKDFSSVISGKGNEIYSENSTIAGGFNNKTKFKNTHILGSDIEADAEDTTFVNKLSIKNVPNSSKGLPKGTVWNNKGVLSIVT